MATECRFCGSTETFGSRKGVEAGKAAAGFWLFGPLGLLLGTGNSDEVVVSCKSCGQSWTVKSRSTTSSKPLSKGESLGWGVFSVWLFSLLIPLYLVLSVEWGWAYAIAGWVILPGALMAELWYGYKLLVPMCVSLFVYAIVTTPIALLYWAIFTDIIYKPGINKPFTRTPTLSEWIIPLLAGAVCYGIFKWMQSDD